MPKHPAPLWKNSDCRLRYLDETLPVSAAARNIAAIAFVTEKVLS